MLMHVKYALEDNLQVFGLAFVSTVGAIVGAVVGALFRNESTNKRIRVASPVSTAANVVFM
jgi:hypothetical protein